jgi:hypothetical protein
MQSLPSITPQQTFAASQVASHVDVAASKCNAFDSAFPQFDIDASDSKTIDFLHKMLADQAAATLATLAADENVASNLCELEPVRRISPAYPQGAAPKPKRFYRTKWRGIARLAVAHAGVDQMQQSAAELCTSSL